VRSHGAKTIVLAVTHAVLCGPAVERLDACPADCILATDTIPKRTRSPRQLQIVSVAPLLARAIRNLHDSRSLSILFEALEE
jgi:ribose-phosphate pyrophosphokinase